MDEVARAYRVFPLGRIGVVERILHRVEVIEVAEIFIETMVGRQHMVTVAQMVLAELPGFIAQRLEGVGDGRRLIGHAQCRARLADRSQPGADR